MSKMQNLIELYTHYSIQVGFDTPEVVAESLSRLGHKYFPISDFNNNFAFVEQGRASKKFNLKPIYSVLLVASIGDVKLPFVVTALSDSGFELMCSLISSAQRRKPDIGEALVTYDELLKVMGADIVVWCELGHLRQVDSVANELVSHSNFKVTYNLIASRDFEPQSYCSHLGLVAVYPFVPVFFADKEDKIYHDYKFQTFRGDEQDVFSGEFSSYSCLLSPEEWQVLVSANEIQGVRFADVEDVYSNSQCNPAIDVVVLPEYPFVGEKSQDQFLTDLVWGAFSERKNSIQASNSKYTESEYQARIQEELDVIISMGFAGYFLIVWDYISWAKKNDIAVGAGRGSGVGSMVAYLLDIVELDPIKYELLFERFLNKERRSMPDIDTDFCVERRGEVIDYVRNRYGEDRTAQISTFTKLGVKASLKDAGRLLSLNVDALCKLVPTVPDLTFESAVLGSPQLAAEFDKPENQQLVSIAKKLYGKIRAISKHAGGVVISKGAIYKYASLYYDDVGNSAVMLDMHCAEAVGLVKFDTLGVANLTMVKNAVAELQTRGVEVDIKNIDLEDPNVYAFLRRCLTQGTFQLFSQGMRQLIRRLQPDCFEELVALIALFRPGPLQSGMVDLFVSRKHGQQQIYFPEKGASHPTLEPVLSNTYGVILYQEQVMRAAQDMAGYSLGQADLLRRAMGKKKPEEMDRQKSIFIDGAVARGVEPQLAEHIFHIIEKFSGYGFNRSHSAGYAVLSYQTLYLKTYYPAVYMASVMTAEGGEHEKLAALIGEIGSYGLTLEPVCINRSNVEFHAVDDSTICYGFAAVKGLGNSVAKEIVSSRSEVGGFTSIEHFHLTLKDRGLNKGHLVALVFAGAFDSVSTYADCIGYIEKTFGLEKIKYAVCTDSESIQQNQIALCGVSFSIFKMLAGYAKELHMAKCLPLAEVADKADRSVVLVGGVIRSAAIIPGQRPRLKADLLDQSGSMELVGWAEFIDTYSSVMQPGDFVICECKVGSYRDSKQLTLMRAWDHGFVKSRLGL